MKKRTVVDIETEMEGLIILKGTIVRLFAKNNGENYEICPDDFFLDSDGKPTTDSVLVTKDEIKYWFQSGVLKLERVVYG